MKSNITAAKLRFAVGQSASEDVTDLESWERQAALFMQWVNPMAGLAVLAGLISYAAFICGTLGILELATAANPS